MKKNFRLFFSFLAVIVIPALCQASTTILTNTSPNHTVASGSDEQVYGTSASNQIILESGAKAELINFPGQNAINIEAASNRFNISRSGTLVIFEGSDGTVLKIPATTFVQTIIFEDRAPLILNIYNGQVMLDDQVINVTPAAIIPIINLSPPDTSSSLMPDMPVSMQLGIEYTGNKSVNIFILEGPEGMKVSPSKRLTWTPGIAYEGKDVPVRIQATDGDVDATLSFTLNVAQAQPIETSQTLQDNGHTRIAVTEDAGNLKGLEIIMPTGVSANKRSIQSIRMQSQVDSTGVGLLDVSAVDMEGLPEHVMRLTDFFRIDPVASDKNKWIEVIFPELELPEDRYPEELELYVFSDVIGAEDPLWVPVSHGLDVTDDGRIRILIAKTGKVSFIGLPARDLEPLSKTMQSLKTFHSSTQDSRQIECSKKSFVSHNILIFVLQA